MRVLEDSFTLANLNFKLGHEVFKELCIAGRGRLMKDADDKFMYVPAGLKLDPSKELQVGYF